MNHSNSVATVGSERMIIVILKFPYLLARQRSGDATDQFTRGRIFGYVSANPGDCYSSIRDNLKLGNGAAAYHLDILEKEGFVRSVTEGTFRRYYPSEMETSTVHPLHQLQQHMLTLVGDSPGLTQRDIAGETGVSQQLASYHLTTLEKRGSLKSRWWGRFKRYYSI